MTNRAKFIEWVANKMENEDVEQEVREYFEKFKESKPKKEAPLITEKGAEIICFMRAEKDNYNNAFTAKVIGEGLDVSGRSVSGSMRKLVTNGFVTKEKDGEAYVYSITPEGEAVDVTIVKE